MKLNAAMMCLAAALLSFPFPAYLPYWLFGLSVVLELIVAAKLSSVTTLLAAQALVQYSDCDFDGDSDSRGGLEICIDEPPPFTKTGHLNGHHHLHKSSPNSKGAHRAGRGCAYAGVHLSADACGEAAAPILAAVANRVPGGTVPISRRALSNGSASPAAPRHAHGPAAQEEATLELSLERRLDADALAAPPRLKPLRTSVGGDAPPAPMGAREITRRIEDCRDLHELEDFVAANGSSFTQIHGARARRAWLHGHAAARGAAWACSLLDAAACWAAWGRALRAGHCLGCHLNAPRPCLRPRRSVPRAAAAAPHCRRPRAAARPRPWPRPRPRPARRGDGARPRARRAP
jgi:hypothetical protein